jgi:hypothetical protein
MAKKKKKQPVNLPETEKQKINAMLDSFNTRGSRKMQGFRQMYRDAIRYTYGDQHAHHEKKEGWEYPVMNRMYADVLQEIAILSGNNPGMKGMPVEDTDVSTADMITDTLRYLWTDELNMRIKIMQGLLDDKLGGMKIAKWRWVEKGTWNQEKALKDGKGWKGKVDVMIWNPEAFGCDESVELAAEIPTKAEFIWFSRWETKENAAMMYPNYKKELIKKGQMDEKGKLIHKHDGFGGVTGGGGTGTSSVDETGFNQVSKDWAGKERFRPEVMQRRMANLIVGNKREDTGKGKSLINSVKIEEYFFHDSETKSFPAQSRDRLEGEPGMEDLIKTPTGQWLDRTKPIFEGKNKDVIDSYEEFNGKFPQKEERPAFDAPIYPSGRFIIRIDHDFLESDDAWPYKTWPVSVGVNYLLPHMWQGANAVELSRGFQDWMNNLASHMEMYSRFFADPIVEVERGALQADLERKKVPILSNVAGAVVRLARGGIGKIRVREPVALPPTLFQIYELLKEQDQDLKGVHDVDQGRASRGQQTLGELQMLNRNSRQRLAMQGAMLDVWLKQMAVGIVELMQTNYAVEDYVRIVGPDKESVMSSIRWSTDMQKAKLDVSFEPTSTMPVDEDKELERYIKAYELVGPAMLPQVLLKLKIAKVDEIVGRHGVLGPFQELMEQAQENGRSSQDVMVAIQQVLASMNELNDQP